MGEFVDGHFHCRIDYAKRGGKKLSAVDKFDYNNRLGRWAKKHEGALGFSESGNMPAWAKNKPRKFWDAADNFERANGTFYYNAEFALPLDLATLEQQLAAAREYVQLLIGDKHPYTLTMHDNTGNHHCDLMWSTSTLDGIERNEPQHFFKRADSKIAARGGCRKAYYDDEWIVAARIQWETVANKHLEASGSKVRIDHRSFKDRGIDKAPGVHLGQKAHRLEKAGKTTWRGIKNREAQHLNACLQEVQSQINQKENTSGKLSHGRPGDPHSRQRNTAVDSIAGTLKRAFTAWRNNSESDRPGLRISRRIGPQCMPTLRQSRTGDGHPETCNAVLQAAIPRSRGNDHGLHSPRIGGGIYVLESLDSRQIFKARLMQAQYQRQIETALAARLAYVDRRPDQISIALKGGGRITDHGDRLLTGAGLHQELMAALSLAQSKGWKTITLSGDDDFKRRAWFEAERAGLTVVGYEPSPDLRAQLAKEKAMLGTPGGASLTPDAAPDTKANAASRRWADALKSAKDRLEAARQSANVLTIYQHDQQRKKVAAWLEEVERRGVNDDLLWQIGHHQVGDGKKAPDAAKAALEPLYQLRQDEIEGRKQVAELERQTQIQREISAQQKADELLDLMNKPGLSAAQEEVLMEQHRYYTALAAGYDEAEARERSANPNVAPRHR